MRTQANRWLAGAFVMVTLIALATPAWAQRGQMRQGQGPRQQLGPMEIQRLFDAYTVMQAQEALELNDEMFARFLPRLTALQETRRRLLQERQRMINRLSRALESAPTADDVTLKEQLQALDGFDTRATAETRAAYEAVASTLDTRRQAQFRVFESQMERRKLELVLRARRAEGGPLQPEPR
jgi:hypothetical protein